MKKSQLLTIGLILIAIMGLAGWMLWPRVTAVLPHRIQAMLATPYPTALPAPVRRAAAARPIRIPTLPPTFTPLPTPTLPPTATPKETGATTAPDPTAITPAATPTPAATATPSPSPTVALPQQAQIDGLEIVPQKFNNCGPTNLSIVLDFYGEEDDQFDVAAAVRPLYDDRNVTPEEMAGYVRAETPLQAMVFRGGAPRQLRRFLAAGLPVIVEKGLMVEEEGWMGHYLTLIGYDATADTFTGLDTFLGPWDSSGRTIGTAELEELWQHFNYALLVVYPEEEAETVAAILGPPGEDPALMWQRAAQRAQETIEAEPANAFAWFNLGSSLTRLGDLSGEAAFYTEAAAAFDEARHIGLPWRMLWYQFEPYAAYLESGRLEDVLTLTDAQLSTGGGWSVEEAHLYRGRALLAQGKETAAEEAYRRAAELNPNHPEVQEVVSD